MKISGVAIGGPQKWLRGVAIGTLRGQGVTYWDHLLGALGVVSSVIGGCLLLLFSCT